MTKEVYGLYILLGIIQIFFHSTFDVMLWAMILAAIRDNLTQEELTCVL